MASRAQCLLPFAELLTVIVAYAVLALLGSDMYSNNMQGSIPEELGDLEQLTSLVLYHNRLNGTVPQALGGLKQLTYLVLDANQLEGTIPARLGNLKQLTGLSLYHNRLEGSIPAELAGLSRLVGLSLHDNRLTGVIPVLPFKNYTGCRLQAPTSPANAYACPLPPDSAACTPYPPTCACTGSSANLATADCGWWGSFYDTTGGGTHWANCRGNRSDPCACRYTDAGGGSRGVTCKGSHITGL
jgi:hypothetical protein